MKGVNEESMGETRRIKRKKAQRGGMKQGREEEMKG